MRWMWIALAYAAGGSPAAAAVTPSVDNVILVGDWTLIGHSDTSMMFIKSATPDGPYRRVLVRFEDGVPLTGQDFKSLASLEVDEIDCDRRMTRIVKNVHYAGRNLTGESREEAITGPAWTSEAPGSFGAQLVTAMCPSP